MAPERLVLWIAFNVFVIGMLALDLGIFHRKAHTVSLKEASVWTVVWIILALVFNLGIYSFWGPQKALEFLTGYVIEKSLSVDNLFVFLMIFHYFATPAIYQHRILFWGIVGALVMRAIFIAAGVALLDAFHWMIYVFGGFLIVTGIKMLFQGDHKLDPGKNPVVRLFRRLTPITKDYSGQHFFVRKDGRLWATPLLLVLVVVETTDVIFAVDSIPAIFAVTRDPFIVYTSNVFAILGLRALYFVLAGVMEMFRYLKVGLSFVLCFVGVKMIVVDFYEIPIGASLAMIAGILSLSILASLVALWREAAPAAPRASSRPAEMGRPYGMLATASGRIWVSLLAVGLTLMIVKWSSIQGGPSGDDAMAAIRVVQRDLTHAQWIHGESPELEGAQKALEQAWSNLERDQYAEAISATLRARSLLTDLHGKDRS
jgi:tellurite resistance protein TerC